VVVQAPLTGYVVAGGRSTRMGRDKALLPWGDATLLDHAIARLARVCGDVRVLCGPSERYADRGRPVVLDAAGGGPLAGLAAALDDAAGADALCLGVDLPNVTVELLAAIAGLDPGADAVVPATARGPEPLCALYRAACREPVAARVARGEFRMTSFWPDVRVRSMGGAALLAFGDPERLFANVNAPEDYRRETG
jgi:molybdopterin-guanine dinucleotide biosynthesis protein A